MAGRRAEWGRRESAEMKEEGRRKKGGMGRRTSSGADLKGEGRGKREERDAYRRGRAQERTCPLEQTYL